MARMALIGLLCLVGMVTVIHSFPRSNRNGPSQFETVEVNAVGPMPAVTNKAVIELAMEENYNTEKPLLSDLLSKLMSERHLRGVHLLHRQRRSRIGRIARLNRLLRTKEGRKLAKRISKKKNLPLMLALIKKKKKLRARKLKEKEEEEATKITEAETSDVPNSNNPSSTNEINLTVQVEMHKPEDNESTPLPSGNKEISVPTLQGMHKNYPFASPRIQVPQSPNNVLGVSPQLNDPYQWRRVPDIYRSQNIEVPRSYPGVAGMLSGQEILRNKPYLGSALSDPGFGSVPYEKRLKSGPPTFNKQRIPFPEDKILSKNVPNIQRSTTDNNLQSPTNEVVSDRDLYPSNAFSTKSQNNIVNAKASSSKLDLQGVGSLNNPKEIKDSTEENKEKDELTNLLKDIKSIVNGLKPLAVNDVNPITANENMSGNEDTDISKTNPVSKESNDIEENEILSLPEESEVNDKGKETLLTRTNWKKAESIQNTQEKSNQERKFAETSELAQNLSILNEVIKDPDAMYEEKLSSLTSDDLIKMLQNFNLISEREKKIIRRISPKWKKDNNIHMIFKELMRRRYFRKAINSLIEDEGMTTPDEGSDHNLIIALLKIEEQRFQNSLDTVKTNFEYAPDRTKSKINVNSVPFSDIFSAQENRPNNVISNHKRYPENIFSDRENLPVNIFPEIENVNESIMPDHQPDTMLVDDDYHPDNVLFDDEENLPDNILVDDENQADNILVDDENQHDNIFVDDESHPHIDFSETASQLGSIFSSTENQSAEIFADDEHSLDSSSFELDSMDDNSSDQEQEIGNMFSGHEHQHANMHSDHEH